MTERAFYVSELQNSPTLKKENCNFASPASLQLNHYAAVANIVNNSSDRKTKNFSSCLGDALRLNPSPTFCKNQTNGLPTLLLGRENRDDLPALRQLDSLVQTQFKPPNKISCSNYGQSSHKESNKITHNTLSYSL